MEQSTGTRGYDAASAVVWFVAVSQGLVPLVAHGLLGREDRIALPLLLPAPWWWITSLAVLVLAAAALIGIDGAKHRVAPSPSGHRTAPEATSASVGGYDALSGLVLLAGLYNGLAPFVSRSVLDGDLLLALPLRLPAPWWWLVSLAVLALTAVLLEWIDRAKKRSAGPTQR